MRKVHDTEHSAVRLEPLQEGPSRNVCFAKLLVEPTVERIKSAPILQDEDQDEKS